MDNFSTATIGLLYNIISRKQIELLTFFHPEKLFNFRNLMLLSIESCDTAKSCIHFVAFMPFYLPDDNTLAEGSDSSNKLYFKRSNRLLFG